MCNYSILYTGPGQMAAEARLGLTYMTALPGRLKLRVVSVCHQVLLKGRRDIAFSFLGE